MTGKKFFTGIPVMALKFGIAVFLSCGLTSCFSLLESLISYGGSKPAPVPEPVEIVYEEIDESELENAINNVDSPGHGFIVDARITHIFSTSIYIEMSNSTLIVRMHTLLEDDIVYTKPPQFEIIDMNRMKYIDTEKTYKIYVGVYYDSRYKTYNPYADKIEGVQLPTKEEIAVLEAEATKAEREARAAAAKAEQEAKVAAEAAAEEAKVAAEAAKAAAEEAKFNPKKLDRSKYKQITVEDFSFGMAAGKLLAGSKVTFNAKFLIKPTGTKYSFDDVNLGITMSSDHNFVRDMPAQCFGYVTIPGIRGRFPQSSVNVYVTVKKPGEYGECSVDIIEW